MSFNIEDAFLDVEAINKGKWVPLGADFPGVEILSSGISSTEAKSYMAMLRRQVPRAQLEGGRLSTEAEERIFRKTIVEKCVHDWRGLNSGGEPLPFAKDTLEKFLTEPKARLIGQAIVAAILDLDNTRATEAEEASGN